MIKVQFEGISRGSNYVYFEPMLQVPRKGEKVVLAKHGSYRVQDVEWIEVFDGQTTEDHWRVRVKLKALRTTIF